MIWLTVPEVRRLLLALSESPERFEFRLSWSCWRRQHQAVARRCHAARRSRRQPASFKAERILAEKKMEPDLGLAEEIWQRLVPLLPPRKLKAGGTETDYRKVIGGILWVQRNGGSWRQLPEQFGLWTTAYERYHRWRKSGVWQRIAEAIRRVNTSIAKTAA